MSGQPEAIKAEPLPHDDSRLRELLNFYNEPLEIIKVLSGSGAALRKSAAPPRIEQYPALLQSVKQLQREQRYSTLLRLLLALQHYETKGVVDGELPPSGDYFNRVLSAAERRARTSVQVTESIVIDDDDDSLRSYRAVDVESYVMQHRAILWDDVSIVAIVKAEGNDSACPCDCPRVFKFAKTSLLSTTNTSNRR